MAPKFSRPHALSALAVAMLCLYVGATAGAQARPQEDPIAEAARLVREGNAQLKKGNFDEAANLYRKALVKKPDAGTWFNLAVARYNDKRNLEALSALNQALRIKSEYPQAHRLKGVILYADRKWADAVRELTTALSACGDVSLYKFLAAALEQLGDDGSAQRALQMAVMADPTDLEVRRALASSLYRAARYHAAAHEFRLAIRLTPADGTLYRQLGYCLTAAGDDRETRGEAIDAFETARRLGTEDVSMLSTLADLYAARGMHREAAGAYEKVLDLRGRRVEDLFRLGALYRSAGRLDDARSCFELALSKRAHHEASSIALGEVLLLQDEPVQAEQVFRAALESARDLERVWTGIGDAAFRQERFKEAASAYRQAVTYVPGDASLWRRLGHAEFSQERYAQAVKAYRRALEFDPGDREATAYLAAAEACLRSR